VDVDVLAVAVDLARRRQPFALATVVRRRAPSSGQLGAKAVIRADGSVEGWLGGACASPTVRRQALDAIGDGRSRLLVLGQTDEDGGRATDDVVRVPMACESDGALEVYVEPILPGPQVVAIGRSPAVSALAELAGDLGWDVVVVDDGGDPGDHPRPELVSTTLDLAGMGIGPATAIVVATQGHYDDLALQAALGTDAGYIGLVAAAKRAASVLEMLAARGVATEDLARVVAPAGLDLGNLENAEIAVAVLAELVEWKAAGRLRSAPVAAVANLGLEAVDPVCGMTVLVEGARYHLNHEGVDHWFCAPGCLAAFERDPEAYTAR